MTIPGRDIMAMLGSGVDKDSERIRTRILIPFTLLLVFVIGAFILAAYRDEEREYRRNLSESVQTVEQLFLGELEKEALVMRSLVETIVHNEGVKAAYLSRHRDALYRHALPIFEEVREDFEITHLYFTDADRVNFLRVHAPDRHGDVIDRGTSLRAQRTREPASGVELGPLGTLTLRVVVPWRDGDRVIGFVELGHEIWHFTWDMKRILGVDMLLLDYKKYLEREGWEEGMRIMGHRADWDRFPTTVAVDWTMDELPAGLIEIMERRRHPHMPEMTLLDREENGRILIAAFLPIFERFGLEGEKYSPGREVGDFAIIRDVTGIHAAFLKSVVWTVALSLLAGGVVFALFYVILGRVEGDVRRHAEALSDEIAERKRAEEALRFTQFSVDQTNEALFWSDSEGRIFYVNDAACGILDYSREELLTMSVMDIDAEYPREIWAEHWEELKAKGSMRFESTYRKKNGTTFPVEITINFLEYEGREYSFAFVHVITERKRAEEALRQSQESFAAIMNSMEAIAYVADMENHEVLFVNKFAQDFFGDITGQKCWQTIQTGQTGPCDFCTNDKLLAADGTPADVYVWEFQNTRNGRWFECRDKAIRWIDGRYVRMEVAHDITERKAMEDELRQAQKMDAIGKLTGGVAHDFNNQLAVILGNLEILEEETEGEERLSDIVRRAISAANRSAATTQRLLAFSRKQPLQPQVIDVNLLVEEMLDLLRQSLGETVEIETALTGDLWRTTVDPGQLENALLNLAVNARDAMPEGGRLTIGSANVSLDEEDAKSNVEAMPGDYMTLSVSDTGYGMPPEVRERAFDPFFTTKGMATHSGLGLSMVYGFVKQSGGHVTIESGEGGAGTTIRLFLPRTEEVGAAEREGEGADRETLHGRGETVLVVEDDADVLRLAVTILDDLGYRTLEAGDGKEALAALDDTPRIDLLLADVVLPGGLGGRDLAEEIRRRHPDLNVLFMSGYTEESIVHDGRPDDGSLFLQKPFRKAELARMVRDALDGGLA